MEAIKADSSSLKDFCLTVALHPTINNTTIQEASNRQGVLPSFLQKALIDDSVEFCIEVFLHSCFDSEVKVHTCVCVCGYKTNVLVSLADRICFHNIIQLKVASALLRVGSTSNLESRLLHSDRVRFVHHLWRKKECRHEKNKLSTKHFPPSKHDKVLFIKHDVKHKTYKKRWFNVYNKTCVFFVNSWASKRLCSCWVPRSHYERLLQADQCVDPTPRRKKTRNSHVSLALWKKHPRKIVVNLSEIYGNCKSIHGDYRHMLLNLCNHLTSWHLLWCACMSYCWSPMSCLECWAESSTNAVRPDNFSLGANSVRTALAIPCEARLEKAELKEWLGSSNCFLFVLVILLAPAVLGDLDLSAEKETLNTD